MIKLIIVGNPVAKGRPRVTKRGFTYTPKKTKNYEEYVKTLYILKHGQTALERPLKVNIKAFFKIAKTSKKIMSEKRDGIIKHVSRPDIDNICKTILDSLNNIAYKDDSQIIELKATKEYSDTPRVEVEIEEI